MENKNLKLLCTLLITASCFAANQPAVQLLKQEASVPKSSTTISTSVPTGKLAATQVPLNIKSNSLTQADQDAQTLNDLKRKLEIQKVQQDLSKSNAPIVIPGNSSNNSSSMARVINRTPSMIATNIIIDNSDGSKLATLLFSDGTSLDVDLDTQLGKYKVQDITMQGVILTTSPSCKLITTKKNKHHKAKTINRCSKATTKFIKKGFPTTMNQSMPITDSPSNVSNMQTQTIPPIGAQ